MPEHCSLSRAIVQPPGAAQRVAASPHPLSARRAVQAASDRAVQLNARSANRTGLPDRLKTGMEALSGIALDDVTVHRNSPKPAQLQAHAFAQGTDIHLAPGQETHLPHEAWHVVQQKQGRVRATAQCKRDIAINDDPGLEREADLMGARALAWSGATAPALPQTGAAVSNGPMPVQRQARFLLDRTQAPGGIKGAGMVVARLHDAKQGLSGKLPDVASLPVLDLILEMMRDETDHGTFDLDSEQGVGFLSFELAQLAKAKAIRGSEKSSGAQALTAPSAQQAPGAGEGVTDTVFLGAGASIAYYIAAGRGRYAAQKSLIIGAEDPWGGKRGPGVVAHPENMITPMLEFLGQKVDSVWAERGRFAQLVAIVLRQSGIPLVPHRVTGVEETHQGLYLIKTERNGQIVARNIIGGMGSGEHRPPTTETPEIIAQADREIAPNPQESAPIAKRVMNMDLFTRLADRMYSGKAGGVMLAPEGKIVGDRRARAGIHLILSGGNGGIDVAFTALQKGFKVTWLVGPAGPSFLEGFFNFAAKYAFDRSLQVRKTGTTQAPQESEKEVAAIKERLKTLYAGQQHRLFDGVVEHFASGTQFEGVYFANAGSVSIKGSRVDVEYVFDKEPVGKLGGDLFVYAHGQDGSALELFGGLLDKMTPIIDRNLRFLSSTSPESSSVEGGGTPPDTVLGMEHRSKAGGSIKLIGAAGFRHRQQNPKAMAPVIQSLPPNVLLNDQLTPTRSQIDAELAYVAPTSGSFADFATADRTQLAVHIAARYPFIPPRDIEMHVGVIIVSRRKGVPGKPELKAVPPHSEAFQRFWENMLAGFDHMEMLRAEAKAGKARISGGLTRSNL